MKTWSPLPATLLAVSLIFAASLPSQAAPQSIGLEVKNVDTSPKKVKDPKKTGAQPEVESSKLTITLRNTSKEDLKALQVKYSYFSRDAGGSAVTILKSGVTPADVPAGKTAAVQSEAATTTFTPAYMEKKTGRIKATGSKIVGYGVQVFNGETLAGEFFSSEAMKKVLQAAPK